MAPSGLLDGAWVWQDCSMRINLFITELRTGGAERCLTELALGLARRGDDVRVLSLAPLPLPPRNELVERLLAAGIPVESCGVRRSGHLVAAVRYVRNWLRESEPDCLQTFLYHANVVGAIAAEISLRFSGFRAYCVASMIDLSSAP